MPAHRILLGEGNEALRHALTRVLEGAGYTVVQITTGKEGLQYLDSPTEFSLLITDLVILDIAELELIKKLHPKLPIMALSLDEQFLAIANWFEVEATLQKPFNISELLKAVELTLGNKASLVP